MPVDEGYRRQVTLLIKTVPLVAAEPAFAPKGGTAINLFVRGMPRLSVDIDLTYVPVADRASSLNEIDAAMHRIAKEIERWIPGARVSASAPKGEEYITKLIVRADDAQIKIEVTPVLRGCVYEPAVKSVSARVEEEFGFAEMPVVSFEASTPARSLPRSTASIRWISSTCGTCSLSSWPHLLLGYLNPRLTRSEL